MTDSDGDVEITAVGTGATMGSVAMDLLKDVILGRRVSKRVVRDGVPMLTVGKTIDVKMEGMGVGELDMERDGDGDVEMDIEMAPLVSSGSRS